MIPGIFDLLSVANLVIETTPVVWYKNTGRVTSASGTDAATYAAGVTVEANMMAVPRNQIQMLGLQFTKKYVQIFLSGVDYVDVIRDGSGDKFAWAGRRWQCESTTEWFDQDGWKSAFLVDQGVA